MILIIQLVMCLKAVRSLKVFLNKDKMGENVINLNFLKRKNISCRMYSKMRSVQNDKFQAIEILKKFLNPRFCNY